MGLEERLGRIDRFITEKKDKAEEKRNKSSVLDYLEGVEVQTSFGSCLKVEKYLICPTNTAKYHF